MTKVWIDHRDLSLEVGQSMALEVTVDTHHGASSAVVWSSTDPAFVTVGHTGVVTARSAGAASISAVSEHDPTMRDSVTVIVEGEIDVLWTRQFGTTRVTDVSVDGLGSAFAIVESVNDRGTVSTTLAVHTAAGDRKTFIHLPSFIFAGIAHDGSDNLLLVGTADDGIVIRQYEPGEGGDPIWTRTIPTRTGSAIAADPSGNVFVTGWRPGTSGGSRPGFVRKYSPAGALLWDRYSDFDPHDPGTHLATDAMGNVIVASGHGSTRLRTFDSNGNLVWSRIVSVDATPGGLAIDPSGGIYVSMTSDAASASQLVVVRAYTETGSVRWSREAASAGHNVVAGDLVAKNGMVYLVGTTDGTLGASYAGGNDAFVRAYSDSGHELWTHQFGTPQHDAALAVAVDASGDVFVAGQTLGTLVPPGPSGGAGFLRKLAP
ncbi:MAG: Ig-like domain-containing protein [Gemmatimonadaceae bacterium]|nr:Ig-like domain-containing protein [Gemmatimonadaceae bacterium]